MLVAGQRQKVQPEYLNKRGIMFYKFPHITSINQVYDAIRGCDEFIVAERDGFLVINYLVNYAETFPTPNTKDPVLNEHYAIRRECRGLIFNMKGKVIARRMHKFFNIGEKLETHLDKIDFSQPHMLLDKLDGSMITPFLVHDELRWGTKMGITDVAAPVEEFVSAKPDYIRFAWEMIGENRTPSFEWCSRKQRIVIDYKVDNLVLLELRHNITGEHASYDEMIELTNTHNLPLVKAYAGNAKNMEALMAELEDAEGIEGYVIRFENGHKFKVKGQWYLDLHRAKSAMERENGILRLILKNDLDDIKAQLPTEDRVHVEAYETAVVKAMEEIADRLKWEVIAWVDNHGDGQKKFAVDFVNNDKSGFAKNERGLLFKIKEGKDPLEAVLEAVSSSLGTQTKVDSIRNLIGGAKWEYGVVAGESSDD